MPFWGGSGWEEGVLLNTMGEQFLDRKRIPTLGSGRNRMDMCDYSGGGGGDLDVLFSLSLWYSLLIQLPYLLQALGLYSGGFCSIQTRLVAGG